jgi:hypothetical protein
MFVEPQSMEKIGNVTIPETVKMLSGEKPNRFFMNCVYL